MKDAMRKCAQHLLRTDERVVKVKLDIDGMDDLGGGIYMDDRIIYDLFRGRALMMPGLSKHKF